MLLVSARIGPSGRLFTRAAASADAAQSPTAATRANGVDGGGFRPTLVNIVSSVRAVMSE